MPDSESEQKVESAEDNEQAVKAEILKNLPPEIQEVAEIGFYATVFWSSAFTVTEKN